MMASVMEDVLGVRSLEGLLGGATFWHSSDPLEQQKMNAQRNAWQQQLQLGQEQNLQQRNLGYPTIGNDLRSQTTGGVGPFSCGDPLYMQGLFRLPELVPMGGQNGPILEKKKESPPWSQETCLCLAMAVVAVIVYPAIKLILGVINL